MPVDIPDEMHRRGRSPQNNFSLEEDLYIRFEKVTGDQVAIGPIRCPDQSVNRSRYSEPGWVLLPGHSHWGFGTFKVQDIPTPMERDAGDPYEFIITHDPEEENYSHSEIRAFSNGTRFEKIKNKKIKLTFRIQLSQKVQINKLPD